MGIPVVSFEILLNCPISQWLPSGSGSPMRGDRKCGYSSTLYTTHPENWTRQAWTKMPAMNSVDHRDFSDASSIAAPAEDARKAFHGRPILT